MMTNVKALELFQVNCLMMTLMKMQCLWQMLWVLGWSKKLYSISTSLKTSSLVLRDGRTRLRGPIQYMCLFAYLYTSCNNFNFYFLIQQKRKLSQEYVTLFSICTNDYSLSVHMPHQVIHFHANWGFLTIPTVPTSSSDPRPELLSRVQEGFHFHDWKALPSV